MYCILRILVLEIAITVGHLLKPARPAGISCSPAPQQFLFVGPALCRDYKIRIFNARFRPA